MQTMTPVSAAPAAPPLRDGNCLHDLAYEGNWKLADRRRRLVCNDDETPSNMASVTPVKDNMSRVPGEGACLGWEGGAGGGLNPPSP